MWAHAPLSRISSGRCRTATSCNHVLMGAIALVEVFMSLTRRQLRRLRAACRCSHVHVCSHASRLATSVFFWPPSRVAFAFPVFPPPVPLSLCHLHCLHVRLRLYFAARSTPAANPFLMAVHVGVFITPLHLINICITFCVPFPVVPFRFVSFRAPSFACSSLYLTFCIFFWPFTPKMAIAFGYSCCHFVAAVAIVAIAAAVGRWQKLNLKLK